MSIMGRRVPVRDLIVLVTVIVLAGLIPVLSRSEVREIHLVTRDMAFYLEGDSQTSNPTLTVRAGESIRIVVRNDDQGLMHDFAVPISNASTKMLRVGERGDVTLTAPTTPGTYEYVCRPHRPMMRGRIQVVGD